LIILQTGGKQRTIRTRARESDFGGLGRPLTRTYTAARARQAHQATTDVTRGLVLR